MKKPVKKAKSAAKSATRKSAAPGNVAKYLSGAPRQSRSAIKTIRAVIKSALPADAIETISYKIPAVRYKGKIVVWFAAFAKHCSFFPTARVIEEFRADLKGLATSKGTVQFPVGKPIATRLIRKMVKARVAQMK